MMEGELYRITCIGTLEPWYSRIIVCGEVSDRTPAGYSKLALFISELRHATMLEY